MIFHEILLYTFRGATITQIHSTNTILSNAVGARVLKYPLDGKGDAGERNDLITTPHRKYNDSEPDAPHFEAQSSVMG